MSDTAPPPEPDVEDDFEDFELPRLNPDLKLKKAPIGHDGAPRWTIYDAIGSNHYKIGWIEFECLLRFPMEETAKGLIESVNSETTLDIDIDDVMGLVEFLNKLGLLVLDNQNIEKQDTKEKPLWEKMVHNYLFFTLPLVKPQNFLESFYPAVSWCFNRTFFLSCMALFAYSIFLTSQRLDEFFNTFMQMFSVQGVLMGMGVFVFLKILHEMGHALMAIKYGVKVPHMGIAFMVMYPVLYTETSGGWDLPTRRPRILIALAGIMIELCLAGVFLLIWNVVPTGSIAQSVAFSAVAISLIGSLFVNLNPLMKFDGYYIISDLTGIDNLQHRAISFARWNLREKLFNLGDLPPEDLPDKMERFLVFFGTALLIYRFFLFLGIAILVYTIFFKPLGPFLMAVELLWFIFIPIFSELKIWWERRAEILSRLRTWGVMAIVAGVMMFLIAPFHAAINAPAVMHAKNYKVFYPPSAAQLEEIHIQKGQRVGEGDLLMRLRSETLERDLQEAELKLKSLESVLAQLNVDPELRSQYDRALVQEIEAAQSDIESIQRKMSRLDMRAPFSGMILDLDPNLFEGRYVNVSTLLFRIVEPESTAITTYLDEKDINRVHAGGAAYFYYDYDPFSKVPLVITSLDTTNSKALSWPELSSVHGGPVPSEADVDSGDLVPRQSVYRVILSPVNPVPGQQFLKRGNVRLEAKAQSAFLEFFESLIALLIRESGLN